MANSFFSDKRPQKPHLVRGAGGLAGEVADLRMDVDEAFDAAEAAIGGGGGLSNYQRTLHVGKHGDDGNNGQNPNNAYETIGAAITAATALTPVEDNPVVIRIVDYGKYAENVVLPSFVHLWAPGAEIAPAAGVALQCNAGNHISLREVEGVASQNAIERLDVAGAPTIMDIKILRVGTSGGGIINLAATGAMLVNAREIFLVEGSLAVGSLAASVGHIHVKIGDIYFQNDNAVGVLLGVSGSVVGNIDHIVDIGSGTNNKGFLINAGQCEVDVQLIVTDIAYEVGGGDLYLKVNRISGNRVVTSGNARTVVPTYIAAAAPVANNDSVDTAAAGQAFGTGDLWLDTSGGGTLHVCVSAAATAAVWLQVS